MIKSRRKSPKTTPKSNKKASKKHKVHHNPKKILESRQTKRTKSRNKILVKNTQKIAKNPAKSWCNAKKLVKIAKILRPRVKK